LASGEDGFEADVVTGGALAPFCADDGGAADDAATGTSGRGATTAVGVGAGGFGAAIMAFVEPTSGPTPGLAGEVVVVSSPELALRRA
jgi:hypothetical protein